MYQHEEVYKKRYQLTYDRGYRRAVDVYRGYAYEREVQYHFADAAREYAYGGNIDLAYPLQRSGERLRERAEYQRYRHYGEQVGSARSGGVDDVVYRLRHDDVAYRAGQDEQYRYEKRI